jgi:hypothetical protein
LGIWPLILSNKIHTKNIAFAFQFRLPSYKSIIDINLMRKNNYFFATLIFESAFDSSSPELDVYHATLRYSINNSGSSGTQSINITNKSKKIGRLRYTWETGTGQKMAHMLIFSQVAKYFLVQNG